MKKILNQLGILFCILMPTPSFAWHWQDLWYTKDQQAAQLLQAGKAKEAAPLFENKAWQAVANYRAGDYKQAYAQFAKASTSDNQYNAGNAAAFSGQYQTAIKAYEKSLELNPNNADAKTNLAIVKKLLTQKKPPQSQSNSKNDKSTDNKNNESKSDTAKNDKNEQGKPQDQHQAKQNPQTKPGQDKTNSEQSKPNEANQDNSNAIDSNAKPEEAQAAAPGLQDQDEDKKQLLRRLAEDPGGLLKQKFMRDYMRRHGIDENASQEVN